MLFDPVVADVGVKAVEATTPVVAVPLPTVNLNEPTVAVPPLSFTRVLLTTSVPYWMPGVTTQSNGLLLPPFPADGYEQTFARRTPAGTRVSSTRISMDESCGALSPAAKGSLWAMRSPT